MQIHWLPLKTIEFNVVDTTVYLKNFVVLKHLFIFVIFLEVKLLKNLIAVRKLAEKRKMFTEKFIFQ